MSLAFLPLYFYPCIIDHHSNKKMRISHLVPFFLMSLTVPVGLKAARRSSLQQLKKGIYDEDLALHRMQFAKPPKAIKKASAFPLLCPLDKTNHLAQRLAERKIAYEQANALKGYTIQLYMGSSRTAALKTQDLASSFVYPPKLHYRQPHYTVQLGFFSDRLEAYFVYLTLVRQIPSAIIRPCIYTRQAYLAAILQGERATSR